jgi:hypothetical protein
MILSACGPMYDYGMQVLLQCSDETTFVLTGVTAASILLRLANSRGTSPSLNYPAVFAEIGREVTSITDLPIDMK